MTGERSIVAVLLAVLTACGGAALGPVEGVPREPGGHLLLVGGGHKPPPVMRHFVRLAGGSDAPIVVFPMASGDPRETGAYYADLLRENGARHVQVIHVDDRRDAHREAYVESVRRASGVWFSGGDQARITSRILDTPLMDALREMKAAGGVVGGTSAGTACQSDPMLVGRGDEGVITGSNIGVSRGLGLFEGVIVDQHFVARRRQNRLLSVVLEHPDRVGIGVDEATAVWAKPDGTIEVLGDGTVLVYDPRNAQVLREEERIAAAGMRMSVLVAGQRMDLRTGELLGPGSRRDPPSQPAPDAAIPPPPERVIDGIDGVIDGDALRHFVLFDRIDGDALRLVVRVVRRR